MVSEFQATGTTVLRSAAVHVIQTEYLNFMHVMHSFSVFFVVRMPSLL